MLETELSPIFGLSLMELIEWIAVATIASGGAAIVGIVISLFNLSNAKTQINLLKTQMEKQRKVDSARFTVDYVDKILEKGKEAISTLYDREKDNTKKIKNDKDVRVLLNGFDNTIQFVNDGVIDKKQVLNTTRITLQMLKKDTEVQRIVKETREGTSERDAKPTAFDKVIKFMNEEID